MPNPDDYAPPGFIPIGQRPPGIHHAASHGDDAGHRHRGTLRIYLGAAPGVGKTYAMLREAHRLRSEGVDIVIGFVETHGRAETAAEIEDLEVVPRKTITYHGVQIEEMDTAAILARNPAIAIVDELAHTNAPGSTREKRWQDVEILREAGIDVIGALNVQHIASMQDLVSDLTGITVRETVPDAVVEDATEIQLVDLPVEALLDRIDLGKVYPPEQAKRARERFFQPGTLTALRELALRRTAEGVDDRLEGMMLGAIPSRLGEAMPKSPVERIAVLLDDAASWGEVVRRGWRLASAFHGELFVFDLDPDRVHGPEGAQRRKSRDLAHDLGATVEDISVRESIVDSVVAALVAERITMLIVGVPKVEEERRWFKRREPPVAAALALDVVQRQSGVPVMLVSLD